MNSGAHIWLQFENKLFDKFLIKAASYYMGSNVQHTTVVDAKSLLSVSPRHCVLFISSENTNITPTSILIQLEKVVQVQLDRGGELWRRFKSPVTLLPIHGH